MPCIITLEKNIALHNEVSTLADQLEYKSAQYSSLKQLNDELTAKENSLTDV